MTSGRGNGSVGSEATTEIVHRGVRWRRTPAGRVSWFNEGLARWVTWSPEADAPPVPPGWGAGSDGGAGRSASSGAAPRPSPASPSPSPSVSGRARTAPTDVPGATDAPGTADATDAMARRPSMRSPYRLAPLLVVVFVVAIAVWQATRPAAHASKADIAAAEALKGDCLARTSGTAQSPVYSPVPVSCAGDSAAVRVVAVLVPGSRSSGACPRGSLVVQVLEPNVVGEPSECVLRLAK